MRCVSKPRWFCPDAFASKLGSHQTWIGLRVGARLAREEAGAVSKHLQTRATAFAGKVDRHPGRSNKLTVCCATARRLGDVATPTCATSITGLCETLLAKASGLS